MNKLALIILDGWGIGNQQNGDAIHEAHTPCFDHLIKTYPHAQLNTFGEEVGLPHGQMGNSEVGHLNIGAGRVVYQELARIHKALQSGSIDQEEAWQVLVNDVRGKRFHILGLCSDGGVHSHIAHIEKLALKAEKAGAKEIFIHAFTDGRDTDPHSGKALLLQLEKNLNQSKVKIATIIGRFYAMDRDLRWERIKEAYDLFCHGKGTHYNSIAEVFDKQYVQGISDEFLKASVLEPNAHILDGDVVLCANFRTDRCREISRALSQEDFPEFGMKALNIKYYTLTKYDDTFKNVGVIFNKENIKMTLGEYLSVNGKTQHRLAETEKYPHVTFFFNGGKEEAWLGESRSMVPSPKVKTYDLQPEMSAPELALKACDVLKTQAPDFMCLNFANPDMVGHTGVYHAIIKAVECTDTCLETVLQQAQKQGYHCLVLADHGNADKALNPDGSPNTAHSLNPVPIIAISPKVTRIKTGKLADVAPSILRLMELPIPPEMTGKVLFD